MAYKCCVCGSNDVDNQGDICELCAIGQDPYAAKMDYQSNTPTPAFAPASSPKQKSTRTSKRPIAVGGDSDDDYKPTNTNKRKILLNGGANTGNYDPYGNDMTPQQSPAVQVYSAGQTPQTATQLPPAPAAPKKSIFNNNTPITSGITKNIIVDTQKRSFLAKWFTSLFSGVPFCKDDDITMFQVFPDYSGTALTASGTACDQVMVYGRVTGLVSDNNEVEIYGKRDSSNTIVAKTIKNKASGTTITPQNSMSAGSVRFLTVALIGFIMVLIKTVNPIWLILGGIGLIILIGFFRKRR